MTEVNDRNMSVIEEEHKTKVLPNSNQDMWLKYLIINLNEIDDLDWV